MQISSNKRLLNFFFPVILILTIIMGIFSYNNNAKFNDTTWWVKHSYVVHDRLDNAYTLTMQVESASTSYLFTRDSNSLSLYNRAASQIGSALDSLERLTNDNPHQEKHIDSLEKLIRTQIGFTNQYIGLATEHEFDKSEQLNYVKQNDIYFARINGLLSEILDEENRLLILREAANNKSIVTFHWVFYSLLVCLFALLLGVIWLIAHIFQRQEKEKEVMDLALVREKELGEMKSRFVSFASHEFRTPLATILSSTSLIERYQEGKLNEMSVKHINRIKSNVKSLIDLLNDFLSLGKLEEGKIDNKPAPINVNEFTDDLVSGVKELAKEGQKIICEVQGEPDGVMVDDRLLKNVLNNLLSNAIKYSPINSEIHFNVIANNNHVSFVVQDHGIGIPEKDQKNLFETFYRASNATQTPGTGLGLCIVKRYLDIMGGNLEFVSKENEGSTFTVHIPRIAA